MMKTILLFFCDIINPVPSPIFLPCSILLVIIYKYGVENYQGGNIALSPDTTPNGEEVFSPVFFRNVYILINQPKYI